MISESTNNGVSDMTSSEIEELIFRKKQPWEHVSMPEEIALQVIDPMKRMPASFGLQDKFLLSICDIREIKPLRCSDESRKNSLHLASGREATNLWGSDSSLTLAI